MDLPDPTLSDKIAHSRIPLGTCLFSVHQKMIPWGQKDRRTEAVGGTSEGITPRSHGSEKSVGKYRPCFPQVPGPAPGGPHSVWCMDRRHRHPKNADSQAPPHPAASDTRLPSKGIEEEVSFVSLHEVPVHFAGALVVQFFETEKNSDRECLQVMDIRQFLCCLLGSLTLPAWPFKAFGFHA